MKAFARANCTKSSTATGCGVLPADTVARSLTGNPAFCKVRYNRGGTLYVPWGYVGGIQCDPIEKKPFFHAHPGALAYSFGMLGCDLHCAYRQNWVSSQACATPLPLSARCMLRPQTLFCAELLESHAISWLSSRGHVEHRSGHLLTVQSNLSAHLGR